MRNLLVMLRKWRPPRAIAKEDPALEASLSLKAAAAATRRFWRQIHAADVEWLDLKPLERSATAIARQLEYRYLTQASCKWREWARTSVEKGGKRLLQWFKVPETALAQPCNQAPQTKLERFQEEWAKIWTKRPRV